MMDLLILNKKLSIIVEDICNRHDVYCNQKYDNDLPYSFHLKAVMEQMEKYSFKYFCLEDRENLIIAGCGHDLIEDARMTYNDVIKMINQWNNIYIEQSMNTCYNPIEIADIIYACTEEKGRNRKERHSQMFYNELKQNRKAVFVKLCDILANVLYSKLFNSKMFEMYQKEFSFLFKNLNKENEYIDIWRDLELLLDFNTACCG